MPLIGLLIGLLMVVGDAATPPTRSAGLADSVAVTYIRIRPVMMGGVMTEMQDTLIVWEPLNEWRR